MNDTSVTLWNTGLPLLILAGVAAVVPWVLVSRETRSQGRVALVIATTAVFMVGMSAIVMSLFDKRVIDAGDTAAGQGVLAWMYLRASMGAVVAWGPVLVLVWLGLAQRVERRKGEDMARGES